MHTLALQALNRKPALNAFNVRSFDARLIGAALHEETLLQLGGAFADVACASLHWDEATRAMLLVDW